MKSGQVRFLIGSTAKMGAGTNVQDRLIALHHLDIGWKPSDVGRSLNIPVAYRSTDAYAKIEVPEGCDVDPVLWQLPKEHIYLVEGDAHDYLVKLCFTDKEAE